MVTNENTYKVAITGASSGIGEATARLLPGQGLTGCIRDTAH